uniref:hypothetical protein n=1 Tax=Cupriavidus necator TaxID=106590 RepID=UPI003F494579
MPTINLSVITHAMIDAAAQVNDLNDALYPLQRAAGIDSGDVAGVFFSGDGKSETTWTIASPAVREIWLEEYLSLERRLASYEQEDDDFGE